MTDQDKHNSDNEAQDKKNQYEEQDFIQPKFFIRNGKRIQLSVTGETPLDDAIVARQTAADKAKKDNAKRKAQEKKDRKKKEIEAKKHAARKAEQERKEAELKKEREAIEAAENKHLTEKKLAEKRKREEEKKKIKSRKEAERKREEKIQKEIKERNKKSAQKKEKKQQKKKLAEENAKKEAIALAKKKASLETEKKENLKKAEEKQTTIKTENTDNNSVEKKKSPNNSLVASPKAKTVKEAENKKALDKKVEEKNSTKPEVKEVEPKIKEASVEKAKESPVVKPEIKKETLVKKDKDEAAKEALTKDADIAAQILKEMKELNKKSGTTPQAVDASGQPIVLSGSIVINGNPTEKVVSNPKKKIGPIASHAPISKDGEDSMLEEENYDDTPPPDKDYSNKSVLIIEDEKPLSHALSLKLKNKGITIMVANNGKQALETIKAVPTPFDLILTDLIMPEMNGFALLEELALKPKAPKIFVVSNLGLKEDKIRAKKLNALRYFVKANTPLTKIINAILTAV